MVDYWGTDAIWLQAKNEVVSFGHTGLLFQYKNKWYYWYWGALDFKSYRLNFINIYLPIRPASTFESMLSRMVFTLTKTFISDVSAKCELIKLSHTTITTKEALGIANQHYAYTFDECFYIKGDFEKSYNYFVSLIKDIKYNLANNNCMQTTVKGLLRGVFAKDNSKNHKRFKKAQNMIIPNVAYQYLRKYFE